MAASAKIPDRSASHDGDRSSESFAQAIRRGYWLLGTVVSSPDVVLGERIAQWFDFIWIDLEHSALTIRDAQLLAVAAKAGGAAAVVRLPRSDSELLGAVLDAGVDGVVAPRIESADEAAALVRGVRYPPGGSRGFAPRRSTGGRASLRASSELPDVACLVQVESRKAIASLDEIAAIEGVDGIIVGTADLSFDLGSPLDMHAGKLAKAVNVVGDTARRHSTAWGVAVGELTDWATSLRAHGGSLLVFSSDTRIYAEAIERCTQGLRAVERLPPANEASGYATARAAQSRGGG